MKDDERMTTGEIEAIRAGSGMERSLGMLQIVEVRMRRRGNPR